MSRSETFLVDTSCLVAAVCTWHQRHADCSGEIRRRRAHGERMVVAGHSALETYAVLTRLPPPHRVSSEDARQVVLETVGDALVTLQPSGYRRLLDQLAEGSVAGGRSYDALIASCALEARASVLLTLNEQHFRQFEAAGLRIVAPRAE